MRFNITKENYKEYGRRWNGSRNLEKPRETVVEVAKSRKLRAPKHYRVVEEISYYANDRFYQIHEGNTDWRRGLWRREAHEQYFDGEG